ncbi:MAG: hypothetical protein ABL958_10265 [Bdellovibrionia bacterium]
MGRDVDPEMLKNLDILMDYEAIEQEESWVALEHWDENQSADDVKVESDAEAELSSQDEKDGEAKDGTNK